MNLQKNKRQMQILLVDPNERVRKSLIAILKSYSLAPMTELIFFEAESSKGTLDIFLKYHPDLLILKTSPNDPSTYRLCGEIRKLEHGRHTGIIFISSKHENIEALSVQCLEMGADDFLGPDCSLDELKARIKAVLRLKVMTDELRSANHRLKLLSMTDELTGLANMRCFNQKYLAAYKKCLDGGTGLAVIMMDLDHFKNVNDSTNHLIGSFVISESGKILKPGQIMSENDLSARYGGDEFIVFSMTSNIKEIVTKAEEIRNKISQTQFTKDGITIRITASIGVALALPKNVNTPQDLIKAADLMLYQSKEQGRDRVTWMIINNKEPLKNQQNIIMEKPENQKSTSAATKARPK